MWCCCKHKANLSYAMNFFKKYTAGNRMHSFLCLTYPIRCCSCSKAKMRSLNRYTNNTSSIYCQYINCIDGATIWLNFKFTWDAHTLHESFSFYTLLIPLLSVIIQCFISIHLSNVKSSIKRHWKIEFTTQSI